MQPIQLRDELKAVSRPALEEYVGARVQQFTRVFAGVLCPGVTESAFEYAYSSTLQLLGTPPQEISSTDSYALRFTHRCRFLGCMRKECPLCKDNPNKKCRDEDNFDECYADGQVLKSKCEADVYLELVNLRTGEAEAMPGVEIAVSVVDGDSYTESAVGNYSHIKELLKNDDDSILLSAYQAGSKTEPDGRLYLRMKEGQIKLPDVCVTDKNDTFHMNSETFGTFRLMARAVRREGYGFLAPLDNIRPAVSGRFIVKTQRALNDYRKSEYPHYKDELTKLKHIGSITAQRLREIQQHLDCPYSTVETVEQLKMLMQYADQNRQVENKLLEMLNMKGKHKHKWDYLREVLAERVVYDDMLQRVWYTDDSMSQGVLFACKQGQVNMERPVGLVQRAPNGRLVVTSNPTGQDAETLKQWRSVAEAAWHTHEHRGWVKAQEQLEMVNAGTGGTSVLIGGGSSMGGAASMGVTAAGATSMSMAEGMDDQMIARRGSVGVAMIPDSARSRRSSAVTYHPGPNSPDRTGQALYGMHPTPQQANSGYADTGLQQQHSAAAASQQKQQPPFQFTSGRSLAAQSYYNAGMDSSDLLPPDVYRTASAPNMGTASSPLFSQHSMESPCGPPCGGGLVGASSGPPMGLGMPGDNILPPPPMRAARYRRLSADASAVRQMTMMQGAAVSQSAADLMQELAGKRIRASAPGNALLEELQVQHQQQQFVGGLGVDVQLAAGNRHALYHFESRGRHTPRSRLSHDVSDTVSAPAFGGVLDASDIEGFLAQNFSFVTGSGEPSFAGPVLGPGSVGSLGLGAPGSMNHSGALLQLNMQQSDQLTGQMQHNLMLSDPSSRMGMNGHSGSAWMGMDLSQQQQQHHNNHPGFGTHAGFAGGGGGIGGGSGPLAQYGRGLQQQQQQQQHQLDPGVMPSGYRELKRCESDSFKRFLAVGLPFSPMEPTPEDLLEGLRRDSGLMRE